MWAGTEPISKLWALGSWGFSRSVKPLPQRDKPTATSAGRTSAPRSKALLPESSRCSEPTSPRCYFCPLEFSDLAPCPILWAAYIPLNSTLLPGPPQPCGSAHIPQPRPCGQVRLCCLPQVLSSQTISAPNIYCKALRASLPLASTGACVGRSVTFSESVGTLPWHSPTHTRHQVPAPFSWRLLGEHLGTTPSAAQM